MGIQVRAGSAPAGVRTHATVMSMRSSPFAGPRERGEAGAHRRTRTPAGVSPFRHGRPPRGERVPRRSGRSDPVGASTSRCGRTRDRDPGCPDVRRAGSGGPAACRRSRGQVVSGQRSEGRRASSLRTPSGAWGSPDGSGPDRRRRVDLGLPGGSARCVEQSAVGRGEMRTAEKSVGGRRCTVGGEPGSARASCGGAREPSRRSRSPGEGEVTGHGVLEAVRRTASSGWVPWSRCVQPGARGARQGGGRGDPRARPGSGSPRALASPGAVGRDRAGLLEDRWGRCGQPVG